MSQISYIDRVIGVLEQPDIQTQIAIWVQNREDNTADQILTQLHQTIYPTSQLRYRFPAASKQDLLIREIFEAAIRQAPEQIIEAAGESPEYPLWKRVVWINTPQLISEILGNTYFKVIFSVAVIIPSAFLCYISYVRVTNFVNTAVIPFIINHTHVQIIRIFNAAMDMLEKAWERAWTVLALAFIGRTFILSCPEIPYVTEFARGVDVVGIFFAILGGPRTIGHFLSGVSFDVAMFGWNTCNVLSLFFHDIAERSQADRFKHNKQHAYNLWMQQLQQARLITA